MVWSAVCDFVFPDIVITFFPSVLYLFHVVPWVGLQSVCVAFTVKLTCLFVRIIAGHTCHIIVYVIHWPITHILFLSVILGNDMLI